MHIAPDRLPASVLHELIEHAPAIIFVKDLEGRYLLVNHGFELLVNRSRELIIGRTDFEIFDKEEALRFRSGDRVAVQADEPVEVLEAVTAEGDTREYLSVKFPLRDDAGSVCATCGITVDMTERGRAKETLQRSTSLLMATLESTADGIVVVDMRGRIVQFNHRFLELWHLAGDELGEQDQVLCGDVILSQVERPEEFRARVDALNLDPTEHSLDMVELKTGRALERYSQPQRLAGTIIGRVWSFRDVTSRVEAERHRDRLLEDERRARAAAEEAVQLRDEFLDIAAHELRTPMTSLKLTIQSLQRRVANGLDPEKARTLTDLAVHQMARLEVLVDMLLDATHFHEGRLDLDRRDADLREICTDVVKQLDEEIARSGSVITIHGAPSVVGCWDGYRLEQAVTNLLTNALKFGRGNPIDVDVETDGRVATLRIRDEGVGISSGVRASLFQRFVRGVSSRHYGGLGVGLYITRSLIEAHGGTIEVTSELGVGSSFVVTLPLQPRVTATAVPCPSWTTSPTSTRSPLPLPAASLLHAPTSHTPSR